MNNYVVFVLHKTTYLKYIILNGLFNFSTLHHYVMVFDSWEEENYYCGFFSTVIMGLEWTKGFDLTLENQEAKQFFFRKIETGNCPEGLWNKWWSGKDVCKVNEMEIILYRKDLFPPKCLFIWIKWVWVLPIHNPDVISYWMNFTSG